MSKRTFDLRKMVIAAAAASGLLIATPLFAASETGPGLGMGPGMMGGSEQECDMGPGMTGGHGHGHGMGPGMMGGHGHGMGPGMMGGHGHGHGMGPDMMGSAGAQGLNLTSEQRAKASKIHDATRKKIWAIMGGMLDASSKLRELLSASARDRTAISVAYKQVAELRQQMFEVGLDAKDEFERILSGDQREQLKR